MSLRDAIESGNYQNYFTDESNQKKKKKTLKEAIEDGTYQNYFEDDVPEESQKDKRTVEFLEGAKKIAKADEFKDGYQVGDISKTVLGTLTDLTQDTAAGILQPFESGIDIVANLIATGQTKLGFNEAANRTREFANQNLSANISEKIANATTPGVLYNIINGTPQKIFNPAEIEYDKNKNFIENYKEGFKKAYLTKSNKQEYEHSSASGEITDEIVSLIASNISKSGISKKMENLTGTKEIGNSKLGATINGGNIGITISGRTLNLPTFAFAGGMASGLQEANEKENISEIERWTKGISGGIIESTTEGLFGLLGVGGNELTDAWGEKAAQQFSSKAGKMLAKTGVSASGEAIEEFLSYAGNFLVDNGIIDKLGNADFKNEWNWGEVGEQMALAFVSSTLTSGGESLLQSNSAIQAAEEQLGRKLTSKEKADVTQASIEGTIQEKLNQINKYTDNENKVYEKLVNDKVNNELKNSTIEQEYSKRVDEQEKMLARDLTEQEKLQVQKEVEEAFDKNEISIESGIDSKKRKEIEKQVKEDLQNGKIDTKQIREILGENTDISKDTLLQNSYIQEQRKSQVYVYEKTESAPKNAVMESAVNANMNNTEISRNLINYVAKVSEDTGVAYRFVNNEQLKELGYSKENKIINGVVSKDGVVYLNSQSKEAINYVLGHETTHLLENTKEYTELQDLVLDYAKQTGIYEETMNSIKETYSDILETSEQFANELTSELTSRLLFTDENFVNQLSVKQPNVFQKIYDYIKHMIKMTTSGSEEAKQLEKIKYNFEKAYRQVNKQTNNKLKDKFSIQNNNGNKYVKIDTDQKVFDGIDKKDYNQIAKMYMQDYLKGKTILNENDNANIGRKGINKYTNPNQQTKYLSEKMQLTPELKNVLEIAEKVSDGTPTKVTTKFPNWEYYKFRFEIDGKQFEGLINIGVDKEGNKHFYEINKIHTTSNSYVSTNKSSSTDSIKNSITSQSEDVNTTTKYSMQESENNSDSFSMNSQNNAKTGVEALEDYRNNKKQEYERIANEFGGGSYFWEANLEGKDRDYAIRMLKKDSSVQQKFIEKNEFEKVNKPVEYLRFKTQEMQNFIKDNNITSLKELINNKNLVDEYFNLWFGNKDSLNEYTKQSYEAWKDLFNSQAEVYARGGQTLRTLKSFEKDIKNINSGVTEIVDEYETAKKLENMPEYTAYVESFIDGLYNKKPKLNTEELTTLAQDTFGTTTNFNIGAYMTPDGKLLNFGDHGYRNDHRDISSIGYDMQEFIDAGNIRMKPEGNGFELKLEPTSKQYETLSDYIDNLKGEVYVEIDIGNNKYDGVNYKEGTPTSKIINDLQYYFRNGKFPTKSEFAQFRYSIQKDSDKNVFDKVIPKGNDYKVTAEDVAIDKSAIKNEENIPISEKYQNKEEKPRAKAVQYANSAKNSFRRKFAQDMKIDEAVNKQLINDSLNQIEAEIQQNGKLSKQRANEIFDYMYSNLQTKDGNYYFDTVDSSYEILDRENFDRNLEPLIQELKLADRYNKEELSNTTSIKDTETLKEVYNQISIKQKKYDKISNKEVLTKRDRAQVDRLINKEITIDELPADVNKKGIINVYNAKYELAELKKETQSYRKQIVSEYRNLAQKVTEDIRTWRDKKAGWKYQINTMKRNLRDIIPNKAEAQKMYDTYFKPITKNNAMIEKEINNYNERISKYEINNQESTYIQMIGEYTYNPESKISNEVIQEFYNKNEKKIDIDKCNKAVEEFRNIYDELFEKINTTLLENGYKPVEYRKGYFPHFIEDKAESVIGKMAEKLGWRIKKDTLPTDIAGITDSFKPGKAWTSFSQQRTGDATDYNALKGYDNYIRGAMDVIYHTEDIQKLRALENEIRYQYSSDGVKEKINEIYANNELDIQEQQNQITEVLDDVKNSPMGNFVTELKNYTNNLANKKATGDRGMEEFWSRETYSVMSNIQNRVSANMVGANISSALTNFIPITQAWSQTSTKNLMRGIKESIAIQFKDDGFADNSTFLTNRTKNADRLYKTGLDTVNDKLGFIFDKVDEFTSNAIVRGKYYDNIEKGMSIQEAMSNADEFAKDVIAGRSKGDMPTVFNKKNPLAKLVTAFQLEVNNQYGYMFKDIPTDLGGEAKEKLVGAFVKMFLGAFFYNMLAEKITGRKSAFSPIDIALDTYKTATNEKLSLGEKVKSIGGDLIGEAPFLGGVAGGGRLPIQAALPSVSDTVSSVADLFDMNVENKTSAINTLKKELSKPLYYVALPFAGGQLKKTIEGLSMYNEDLPIAGSYTNSGKLRYTVSEDLGTKIKAGIFGQYSVKEAKEYFDEGYSSLTEKQTQELVELDIPMSDYRQYKNKLKEIDKIKQDEIDDGTSKLEMKLDYINELDLSNEQKNILANNATTRKDKIDMSKYDEYSGLEEMDFATKNPSKYKVIKTVADYKTYNNYSEQIKELKEKYSTDTKKKRATVDFINDLPLNVEQKAVMIKLNYNSINDNNPIIVNYINNLDLDTKEKIEIFEKLGFTYKGGRLYD